MELREQLNGIQHVGIPTNDIEMTIAFYEKLGFDVMHDAFPMKKLSK